MISIPKFTLCALLLTFLFSSPGSAQAPERSETSDVIVLHDGSFVRGTLVEYVANDYAVLLTRGGQQRKFAAAEIKYAGPAAGMPREQATPIPAQSADLSAAPPPRADAAPNPAAIYPARAPIPQAPQEVAALPQVTATGEGRVHFRSDVALEIFERTGVSTATYGSGAVTGESYAPLCVAPCDTHLKLGTHVLGISLPGKNPPLKAGSIQVRDGTVVDVAYQSRRGIRVGGVLFGVAGYGTGLGLMLSDIGSDELGGRFWGGVATMAVGTLVWLVMGRLPDSATVNVK